MKHVKALEGKGMFRVVMESGSVQGAVMVLGVGKSSSDVPEDEHPKAEQWVYVVSGSGVAKGRKGRGIQLSAGSMLYIAKNEAHQIKNTGWRKLVTVNFYAPPAYTKSGEVRRSVVKRAPRRRGV